jgi:hypothetical protein
MGRKEEKGQMTSGDASPCNKRMQAVSLIFDQSKPNAVEATSKKTEHFHRLKGCSKN